MKNRIIPVLISFFICSMSYAQLTLSSKKALDLTAKQKNQIYNIINTHEKGKLDNLVVSNGILQKIHEYDDYGPYMDGQTIIVNKSGIVIQYEIVQEPRNKSLGDSNYKYRDVTGYTYFIPDDKSKVYFSYTMRFGFPPSYGGAAKTTNISDWQIKILKLIKK